ncbi:MAG: NfeD family protein [Opitutae bacterium]|jgi:membrane-bound ClpP family serine protease
MNAIVLLFVTGALLLAAEIFLPGAIAGVIGTLALLAGSILSFREFGFNGGLAASGAAVALVFLMLYLELGVLPKTAFGRKMIVQAKVDATSQPPIARLETVLDKPAEALTTLSPSGYVLVDGRRYEAFCRDGQAPKGATLRVVGVDNFRLIVTQS